MIGGMNAMKERTGIVTSRGKPVTLLGNEVKVGDAAPDFTVVNNDMVYTGLSVFKGKTLIISSVPSLDTHVCDIETRRFNVEAGNLGSDVAILTISMDLPFAQKRWCGAAGVNAVQTLSDYREASFGTAYGVLVKETRLLARAVFVVDKTGVVRYVEFVKDQGTEPDYGSVIEAVRKLNK